MKNLLANSNFRSYPPDASGTTSNVELDGWWVLVSAPGAVDAGEALNVKFVALSDDDQHILGFGSGRKIQFDFADSLGSGEDDPLDGDVVALCQYVVNGMRKYRGQDLTLSFWAKGNNASANGLGASVLSYRGLTAPPNVPAVLASANYELRAAEWKRYKLSFRVPNTDGLTWGQDDYLSIRLAPYCGGGAVSGLYKSGGNINLAVAQILEITNVQLELGTEVTPYEVDSSLGSGNSSGAQVYYFDEDVYADPNTKIYAQRPAVAVSKQGAIWIKTDAAYSATGWSKSVA